MPGVYVAGGRQGRAASGARSRLDGGGGERKCVALASLAVRGSGREERRLDSDPTLDELLSTKLLLETMPRQQHPNCHHSIKHIRVTWPLLTWGHFCLCRPPIVACVAFSRPPTSVLRTPCTQSKTLQAPMRKPVSCYSKSAIRPPVLGSPHCLRPHHAQQCMQATALPS